MRVALCQLEVEPGHPRRNLARALGLLDTARARGADLALLPEMALPGYLLGDLWERGSFLKETLAAQDELVAASGAMAVAFGGLALDRERRGEDGRVRKFNACFLAKDGRLVAPMGGPYPFAVKALLPNYREFDETRHFFDARRLALEAGSGLADVLHPFALELGGRTVRLGAVLCEDSWSESYGADPQGILAAKGAEVIVNLSASPFTQGKAARRGRLFTQAAARLGRPVLYCNCTGVQDCGKTVYAFDGSSALFPAGGGAPFVMPAFEEGVAVLDPCAPPPPAPAGPEGTALLWTALRYAAGRFLARIGLRRVVIGASGGVDSALAAALYAGLLPPEDLLLLNMPSRHNTATTRAGAEALARNLGCLYGVAGIEEAVALTARELSALRVRSCDGRLEGRLDLAPLVMENVQARDRSARLLAAVAAAFGGGFTCNANKSELTVGYCTLYGDGAGFLAALADLWKHQVYELARHVNAEAGRELIPRAVLEVKPSAELSADQNPEEGKGDPLVYPYHDFLFRAWVEDWERKSPEEILEWWLDGSLERRLGVEPGLVARTFPDGRAFVQDLERWWRAYAGMGLAKRIQAPPVLAVSRRAYGADHREAQTGILFTRAWEELKARACGPA